MVQFLNMNHIGIECESIEEGEQWGVGRIVSKLLETISAMPELAKEFKIHLYFKSKVPQLSFLNNPIFQTHIITPRFLPPSFSLYYYVFLPIYLYLKPVDAMYLPNYMLPIIFKGKSLVTLTEDVYYEARNPQLPFRYRLAYRIFPIWAAWRATKIEAFTEASKKRVAELFNIDPKRIIVNPHGVDIKKADTKVHFEKEPYIAYLAQAFPRRHLRETILAFKKIAAEFPELELKAVGRDNYQPPIIERLVREVNKELGAERVHYTTYIPEEELVPFYAKAQALAYVSSREAFGLSPVEALGYGTMPIVADDEVTREIFGEHAFFVKNPDSVDDIAQAMCEALTNTAKRENIADASLSIVRNYTWQAHTERFLATIRTIIHE